MYTMIELTQRGGIHLTVGERIKQLREKKGMNQKQLAEKAKMTRATISRIETGQVKEVKSEALKKLAVALGVTVDFLVGQSEEMSADDMIIADDQIKNVMSDMYSLGPNPRQEVEDFVRYLLEKEKKRR